jgi:hypothetical protein
MLLLNIVLPIILLVLLFLLKSFIKQDTSVTQFVNALIELPSDIVFLGLSFLSATMIKKGVLDVLILFLFGGIILEIITIMLWRISIKKVGVNNKLAVFISALNYCFSVLWLMFSISNISK